MLRFALNDLLCWLNSHSRNPLVIRGARQVGKTWIARELAKTAKLHLIEINFEQEPAKKELFNNNDPHKVLLALETITNQNINPNQSLLFLDEIQAFPQMLAKLRWFKELMPELAVIVAGSLLEFVLEEHNFSMPVGRISYFHLEPCSFEEFLCAKNQKMLQFIQEYNWDDIDPTIHNQALQYLQEYTIIGGLPAAITSWLEQRSLIAIQQIQRDIVTTYRDDFMRYKGRYEPQFFEDIINYIPANIGNKIVYSHINKNTKIQAASLKQILKLITQAKIIHPIKATAANGIPIAAEVNDKYQKAIFLDTGLMNNILGINLQDFKSITDIDFINKGAIAEQLVGQLLRTIEPYYIEPKLFYWQRNHPGSNAEIDYIIQHHTNITPIEVKAGTKGSMQSLHLFMDLKKLTLAIRFNTNLPSNTTINTKAPTGNYVKYKLISLPIYLVGQLKRLLSLIK